jgi:hypothetical protein
MAFGVVPKEMATVCPACVRTIADRWGSGRPRQRVRSRVAQQSGTQKAQEHAMDPHSVGVIRMPDEPSCPSILKGSSSSAVRYLFTSH